MEGLTKWKPEDNETGVKAFVDRETLSSFKEVGSFRMSYSFCRWVAWSGIVSQESASNKANEKLEPGWSTSFSVLLNPVSVFFKFN